MQMHCREHKKEEYKQLTPLETYLVSLIQLYFTSFIYSYFGNTPTAPTFYINDHEASV